MYPSKKHSLSESISKRVTAGKTGAVSVLRSPDGHLVLHATRRALPVIDLRIRLEANGQLHQWGTTDFCGTLLLDDHGPDLCETRLTICDENARQILSSDEDTITGQIIIVAQGQARGEEPHPLTGWALFQLHGAELPRSTILWDASDEFLYFADLAWELAQRGLNNA